VGHADRTVVAAANVSPNPFKTAMAGWTAREPLNEGYVAAAALITLHMTAEDQLGHLPSIEEIPGLVARIWPHWRTIVSYDDLLLTQILTCAFGLADNDVKQTVISAGCVVAVGSLLDTPGNAAATMRRLGPEVKSAVPGIAREQSTPA
jgi:hypothetical protein